MVKQYIGVFCAIGRKETEQHRLIGLQGESGHREWIGSDEVFCSFPEFLLRIQIVSLVDLGKTILGKVEVVPAPGAVSWAELARNSYVWSEYFGASFKPDTSLKLGPNKFLGSVWAFVSSVRIRTDARLSRQEVDVQGISLCILC